MDTISRESNSSILPIGALIAGVLGLLLAVFALFRLSSANQAIATQNEQLARVESMEAQVRQAVTASEKAGTSVNTLARQTQESFNTVAAEFGKINNELAKIQETAKAAPRATAPTATASAGSAGSAVAGANEYIVKSGDTGVRIAREAGVSLSDLMAANPGVNWNSLRVGQRLNLPRP